MLRKHIIVLCFSFVAATVIYFSLNGCNTSTPEVQKEAQAPDQAKFIGSTQCSSCHTQQHSEWLTSDHFKAMMPAGDSTVLGDFNNAILKADGVTSTFFRKDNKYFVNTEGADGKNMDFEIKYTFGHYPLQQYLVEFPGGRMQSLRVSWDVREKKWFHQYKGQNIYHNDWLHWTGASQNWNTMCASCHSTNLQKNYNVEADNFKTTYNEMNVSCESCHGPGSKHVDFIQSENYKKGEKLFNSGFVYSRDTVSQLQLNTCAPCHARKSDISDSLFHTGELLDNFIPQNINNEFYFADGQIKDEVYEFGSFTQSKMFHKNVRCSNCHNPHSGKLKLEGNLLCISCHKPEYDNPAHHFHAINTEGSKCVNCHMAEKTYMGNDHRRDHSFRIPRPDQTVMYGTPNACNSCHANKTPQWASSQIVKHFGPQRTYHFSDDLIPGSLLNEKSEMHLVKLLSDTLQPIIARATAAEYLSFIGTQSSADALLKALSDKHALVRYHALTSLEKFPENIWRDRATTLLNDNVRAVRIAAASLFHISPGALAGNANYVKADSENKKYLLYQTDFAAGNVMLADYYLQDKNYMDAVKFYVKGLQKDSLMNYARFNLSVAYNSIGNNEKALSTLQTAVAIDPKNDRAFYNLGLLYYEMNKIQDAMNCFSDAVKLNSNITGVYYNYGLLLQQQNKLNEAEQILLKGIEKEPAAENLNYALAYFYLQQKQPIKAKAHANVLKQINPSNPQYSQLFKAVSL